MPDLAIWILYVIFISIFVWLLLELVARLPEEGLRGLQGPAQQYGDAATPLIKEQDQVGSRAQSGEETAGG